MQYKEVYKKLPKRIVFLVLVRFLKICIFIFRCFVFTVRRQLKLLAQSINTFGWAMGSYYLLDPIGNCGLSVITPTAFPLCDIRVEGGSVNGIWSRGLRLESGYLVLTLLRFFHREVSEQKNGFLSWWIIPVVFNSNNCSTEGRTRNMNRATDNLLVSSGKSGSIMV